MQGELLKTVEDALSSLPSEAEVRHRIAQNLQERQLLRRVLKLTKDREQAAELSKESRNDA